MLTIIFIVCWIVLGIIGVFGFALLLRYEIGYAEMSIREIILIIFFGPFSVAGICGYIIASLLGKIRLPSSEFLNKKIMFSGKKD